MAQSLVQTVQVKSRWNPRQWIGWGVRIAICGAAMALVGTSILLWKLRVVAIPLAVKVTLQALPSGHGLRPLDTAEWAALLMAILGCGWAWAGTTMALLIFNGARNPRRSQSDRVSDRSADG